MAQAHINVVRGGDITITDVSKNRITCRLDVTQEVTIKNIGKRLL